MANPTKPKDAKPRAEGDDFEIKQTVKVDSNNSAPSLITIIGIVVVAVLVVIATNYILVDMKLSQISKKIAAISATTEEDNTADEGESVSAERGIILDLGEFILNLSDTNTRKFLKVNVAIELSKKESDAAVQASSKKSEKEDSMSAIETEMNQFKPAIRDSIISILSSKTSDELSTTPGKELAKEQLKEAINAIFEGDREVLRVSFGSFFIQ